MEEQAQGSCSVAQRSEDGLIVVGKNMDGKIVGEWLSTKDGLSCLVYKKKYTYVYEMSDGQGRDFHAELLPGGLLPGGFREEW